MLPLPLLVALAAGTSLQGPDATAQEVPNPPAAVQSATSPAATDEVATDEAVPPTLLVDAEIEPWRLALLERAFEIATRIPVDPHVKDRSRTQSDVLDAMLELDQPLVVDRLASRIDNWRRAETLAKVALHAARRGVDPTIVREYIRRSDENHPQDLVRWRHDRIDVNLALALVRIGEVEAAARMESAFEPAQQGRVIEETVADLPVEKVPVLLEQLDRVIEIAQLDLVLNAIDIMTALHARFYDDVAMRTDLERRIDEAAVQGRVPHDIRVRANLALVDEAVARGDEAHARLLVGRARGVLDSIQARTPFPAEYLVPLVGDVARRRAAAGDVERARTEIEDAIRIAEENRRIIADVFLARALRPVALAAVATGDGDLAEKTFTLVVEAGAENPNSRPQAEDLARTLAAMAVAGHRPGDALSVRIDEIVEGLGDPW